MDRSRRQTFNDPSFAEHDTLDGLIVSQHGDHGVTPTSLGQAGGGLRTLRDEPVNFRARPVVDSHGMAGTQNVRRHASSHMS
jgi:hypothetical protein